jgi:branched-chain amino acid transport system substrate-binding protein
VRALTLISLLLLAGCAPKEKVVRIAVAAPLTGDIGTEGQGLLRAVELAVEEANAARRLPFRLEVAPFDDRADAREAVNVAHLIVSDARISAVIGHYNSGCALSAAKAYASGPIPFITPAATHPDVTRQQFSRDWKGPRVVFRVVPTDDLQGAFAGRWAFQRLRKRRLILIHDRTPYGQGLAEQFEKAFVAQGGRVAAKESITPGEKDYKTLLSRLKAEARADGIFFGGLYTEAGLLARQMRELDWKIPFLSGDGAKTPALFEIAGPAADGMYATMAGVPVELLPGAAGFVERYRRRWQSPSEELKPVDHYAYEAANILIEAMVKVGPQRNSLLAALPKTKHKGILGLTTFDGKGDTLNRAVTMTRADAKTRTFPAIK